MNSVLFVLRIVWRLALFGAFYLAAWLRSPENAFWWALGAMWLYIIVGWIIVLLHRATLKKVKTIRLGPTTPRFVTPKGILSELALIADNIAKEDRDYDFQSPKFPLEIDRSMDDVINSMSQLQHVDRNALFDALSRDASNVTNSMGHDFTFWSVIMRLASRAVRDAEPTHIVRGVYAAQASIVAGADHRDVLVSYSALWDAARRTRVRIRPAAQEIASTTPDLNLILTLPPAGLKSMGLTTKKDEYGFRYEFDETWSS